MEIIETAKRHLANDENIVMRTSALLCLEDAMRLEREGRIRFAYLRALKSLAYSVGIYHPDYQRFLREIRVNQEFIGLPGSFLQSLET